MAEARRPEGVQAAGHECRPDQLFGVWAIEETRFRQYVALAKAADLEKLRAESMAAAGARPAEPLYQASADGIAVIDITGPMTKYPTSFQVLFGGTSTLRIREALRAASRDPDVLGIMLRIDSPGGTVAGGAELAEDIRRAAARKPLHTYADDLAASAGLLALAQGRKAWASTNAIVGSIGVYMVVEDTSQYYQQHGVKVHVISSAPPIKGAGVDGTEVTPPQLAEWQRQVAELADWFVGEVSQGRRSSREDVQKLATGQVWVGEKARELGLIDGVATFDEALQRLRSEVMNEQEKAAAEARAAEALAKAEQEKSAREKAEAAAAEALAKAKAAEEKLAKIEAEQRAATFEAKAKALKLPKDTGAILEKVERAIGADFERLETALKAVAAQVDESKLFAEVGTGAADVGAGTALEKASALARTKVGEGKAKSFQEGLRLVWAEHPELWEQHENERGA
jgi:signal peptide peptidase SppA